MVKNKALEISLQLLSMKRDFPQLQSNLKRAKGKSKLIVIGNIKPTPLSCEYKIRLVYDINSKPDIEILEPELTRNFNGEKIPHVYPGNKLCLYFPPANEWNSSKLISKYIIPWISEWLLYYEVWLSTGEWLGGGIHPKKEFKQKSKKSK